jgi:hypothetical protein
MPVSPFLNLRPSVAQCDCPIEDEITLTRIIVHTEIAEALELEPILRLGCG